MHIDMKFCKFLFVCLLNLSLPKCSETKLRGTMMTISDISFNLGTFIVIALGAIFSWRQVALMCALSPICCIAAILFVNSIKMQ